MIWNEFIFRVGLFLFKAPQKPVIQNSTNAACLFFAKAFAGGGWGDTSLGRDKGSALDWPRRGAQRRVSSRRQHRSPVAIEGRRIFAHQPKQPMTWVVWERDQIQRHVVVLQVLICEVYVYHHTHPGQPIHSCSKLFHFTVDDHELAKRDFG